MEAPMKIVALGVVGLVASLAAVAEADGPIAIGCGDTFSHAVIDQPGEYALASDCAGAGIWITANDVTLRLNGHTLANSSMPGPPPPPGMPPMCLPNDGIRGWQVSNLHIVGPGTVSGYFQGMYLYGVSGARVENVTIADSCMIGIIADQSQGSEFRNLTAVRTGAVGIRDQYSSHDHWVGCTSSGNGSGFEIDVDTGTKIESSTASGNRGAGFDLEATIGAKLDGNTSTNNGDDGIFVGNRIGILGPASSGNDVHGNTASGNARLDLEDGDVACASAQWSGNHFATSTSCIR
jgi:hypothetical protein